jgi:hypothetical protein
MQRVFRLENEASLTHSFIHLCLPLDSKGVVKSGTDAENATDGSSLLRAVIVKGRATSTGTRSPHIPTLFFYQ